MSQGMGRVGNLLAKVRGLHSANSTAGGSVTGGEGADIGAANTMLLKILRFARAYLRRPPIRSGACGNRLPAAQAFGHEHTASPS